MADRLNQRAMTPVVSKTLVIGIALLYIGGMTTLLFGGVVPDYQRAAGEELAERTAATAAGEIENTVIDVNGTVERTRIVELPRRIDDEQYDLKLRGRVLVLDHPDSDIEVEIHLSVPPELTVVESSWRSGNDLEIRVAGEVDNRTIEIQQ